MWLAPAFVSSTASPDRRPGCSLTENWRGLAYLLSTFVGTTPRRPVIYRSYRRSRRGSPTLGSEVNQQHWRSDWRSSRWLQNGSTFSSLVRKPVPEKYKVCTGCSGPGGYATSWQVFRATTPQGVGRLLRLSSHCMDANQGDLQEIGSVDSRAEGSPRASRCYGSCRSAVRRCRCTKGVTCQSLS